MPKKEQVKSCPPNQSKDRYTRYKTNFQIICKSLSNKFTLHVQTGAFLGHTTRTTQDIEDRLLVWLYKYLVAH